MAKLYAEITSDKGGRVVGKGGDKVLIIDITSGGRKIYGIYVNFDNELTIYDKRENKNTNVELK